MRTSIAFIVAAVFMLLTHAAWASPESHSDGFFFRGMLGGGFDSTKTEVNNVELEISGGTGVIDLAAGGILAESFALHASIFGLNITNPTFTIRSGAASLTGEGDAKASLVGVGVGGTYYFMPSNFYLSAALGVTVASLENSDGETAETENGFGVDLLVGKEWWVSESWGLGLAGQFVISSNDDSENNDAVWTSTAFSLLFSATYN